MTRRDRTGVRALHLLVALALLAACAAPGAPGDETAPSPATPTGGEDDEPDREVLALGEVLRTGRSVLADAQTMIAAAAEGDAESAAHAVALLTASQLLREVAGAPSDPRGFLPGEEPGDDVLSVMLARVREAGGAATPVGAILQDPVAGDLTTWQRRPDDRNEAIADAARDGDETSIDDLDGHVPRATAWAVIAAAAASGDARRDAAERAAAHLAVSLAALDQALGTLPDGDR